MRGQFIIPVLTCQLPDSAALFDVESLNAYIHGVNNHARCKLDGVADMTLHLTNQRWDMTAIAQNDFARDSQASVLVVLEDVLNRDIL